MIIFRADGNPNIGAGHIMRCLAIANKAKDFGEKSLFITSSDHFQKLITDNGHGFENLRSDYSMPKQADIFSALETYEPIAVFVDSYYITEDYLSVLHEKCHVKGIKLVYVDDRCVMPYSCDYLLNYNIFAQKSDYEQLYLKKSMPTLMLGSLYSPLRDEFIDVGSRVNLKLAKKIFVSTGGADIEHLTLDIVEKAIEEPKYTFHVVLGMMNPDRDKIVEKAKTSRNIILHENVKHMRELMCLCDVAISAAGSTLYELCATQTPSVTYVLADNQIPAAEEFAKSGIMKNAGDIRQLGNKELAARLREDAVLLADNYNERERVSGVMSTVVDGKGSARILEKVLG